MIAPQMSEKVLKSGLGKPLPLDEDTIKAQVDNGAGWSSSRDGKARFAIRYVRHVDGDLGEELRKHIGKYKGFRFKFFRSTRNAYDRECEIYHAFKPSDNADHPEKPKNTKFTCPVPSCTEFG